jgi:hypothetical protein
MCITMRFANRCVSMQIKVTSFQRRYNHCAGTLCPSSEVAKVVIFGGCPNSKGYYTSELAKMASTYMLQFGESA